jgi:hypothetical protein
MDYWDELVFVMDSCKPPHCNEYWYSRNPKGGSKMKENDILAPDIKQ